MEVVYCCGEASTLKPPFALAAGELFALHLPLNKVELGLEAFGLLIMTAVSLDLAEQPPVWEGCDAVMKGEVRGGGAFKKPSKPPG